MEKKNIRKRVVIKNNGNKSKQKLKISNRAKIVGIMLITLLILFILSIIFLGIELSLILLVLFIIFFLIGRALDKSSKKRKKRKILKYIILFILFIGIICILALSLFFLYIAAEGNKKYDVSKLQNQESTVLYDSNGKIITTVGSEQREKLTYNQLPQVLVDAVVSVEDSRYFQHNGFDVLRFTKASIGQLITGSEAGGASTLTMQVVKNAFTSTTQSGIKGIIRKFTDIYISVFKFEKDYSKEQILEFYVNTPFLGNYSYGVEQASQAYFKKNASQLNLAEASLLAGLFQAPSAYDPTIYPENATKRRSNVLYLMKRHGYITEEERQVAEAIPVESLVYKNSTGAVSEYQGYIDTVVQEVVNRTGLDPYVTPMVIYTNMNRSAQDAINNVANGKTYTWRNDTVQAGAAAIDTNTGKLIAIFAGRNKTAARTFNYATDIVRQIGSTAKPLFDYGPGIEYNNWSTGKMFDDKKYTYSDGTTISNFDGRYLGPLTMRMALVKSRNIPALQAFQQIDNKKIVEFVTTLGLKPEINDYGNIHEAHAIGGFDGASPIQMAAAYAAFANGGYYYEPYSVNKIILRNTNETMNFKSDGVKAMSDATAYMISDMLRYGVNSGNIGVSRISGIDLAGKTGTTDFDPDTKKKYNMSSGAIHDSWIVGFSPDVSIGLWYGYKEFYDKETNKVHYITMNQSGIDRKAIFKAISLGVMPRSGKTFTQPSSVVKVKIEVGTDPVKLASASTPSNLVSYELFKKGSEPKEISSAYTALSNVSSLSITTSGDTANLSWTKANEPAKDNTTTNYGDFGYEIYKDNVYVDFTTKTTYSFTPGTLGGTYTIKTAYSSYKSNRSSGTSKTYTTTQAVNYTLKLNPNDGTKTFTIGSNDYLNYTESSKPVMVIESGADVTSSASIATSVLDSYDNITTINNSIAGTYKIRYTVTYKEITKTITRTIIFN